MFEKIQIAPPDPILGLSEAFRADQNPTKINLAVGVYKDATGATPVLDTVKEAERRMLADEVSKGYLPMTGDPTYGRCVRELLFGEEHEILTSRRLATAHTPGGTGALRVAADYLADQHPDAAVWISDPSWANHATIFAAAGVEVKKYSYRDPATNGLDFDAMYADLEKIPAGDVIILHGCCHNPTGIDPTPEQWLKIAELLAERSILPLVDFAYHGLSEGLEQDRIGILTLIKYVKELFICSSYSKNFGLYCERTGALTVVAADEQQVAAVMSQIKLRIRYIYSNPPAHGAGIVTTILSDSELKQRWVEEVGEIRNRINEMRRLFVTTMRAKGSDYDFSAIMKQRGMFSFSGLNKEQVARLRDEYSIYIVGSGRINVAGMTRDNMESLCEAILTVM